MQQSPVSRGNAVEDAPKDEAAARRDQDASLLIVGRSSIGQLLEGGALDLDALAVRGVAPGDHLVDEVAARSSNARQPRSSNSSCGARLRWPWELSIENTVIGKQ